MSFIEHIFIREALLMIHESLSVGQIAAAINWKETSGSPVTPTFASRLASNHGSWSESENGNN